MQIVTPQGVSGPEPSRALLEMIENQLQPYLIQHPELEAITLNFRDPDYSPEEGGYHPVEIKIERHKDAFQLVYITDFAYVGQGYCVELAKALDFDWSQNIFEVQGFPPQPLEKSKGFYELFEANFLSYYQNDVFEVTVTLD